MPGPGWRRLDVAELAPVDGLEAALLAVVRGEIHGATLQRVADLLGGRAAAEPGAPLPGALLERRLCPLEAEERVDRAALLALWRWASRSPRWLRRGWRQGSAARWSGPMRCFGWPATTAVR